MGQPALGDAKLAESKSRFANALGAADDEMASPISMKGMASALKAAASNRKDSDDDDGDWSD